MSDLDTSLRDRLRRAADEEAELSVARPTGQAARMLAAQGPRLVQRAQRVRAAKRVAVVAACAAVPAALLGLWAAPSEPSPGSTGSVATAACADPAPVGPLAASTDHGSFQVQVDGEARVALGESCRTVIELAEGSVDVNARDLRGGRLEVVAPGGAVEVLGTVFRVESRDGRFAVAVGEGRVRVAPSQREAFELAGGQAYRAGEVEALRESTRDELHQLAPERVARVDDAAGTFLDQRPDVEDGTSPDDVEDRAGSDVDGQGVDAREQAGSDDRGRNESARNDRGTAGAPAAARQSSRAREGVRSQTVEELVQAAEQARRAGRTRDARRLFRQAGQRSGPTAEGAWVRLARLELGAGRPASALQALRARSRFGAGFFGAEALWIEVQARERRGDQVGARRAASLLLQRHPGTAQSGAAERWLAER